jgi:hypothetical protein
MIKRVLLTTTFVAALAASSLGLGSKAMAWNDCGNGYTAAYPYTTSYVAYGSAWAPRVAFFPPVPVRTYPVYYGPAYDRHQHHDHHHNGLTVSFGF